MGFSAPRKPTDIYYVYDGTTDKFYGDYERPMAEMVAGKLSEDNDERVITDPNIVRVVNLREIYNNGYLKHVFNKEEAKLNKKTI